MGPVPDQFPYALVAETADLIGKLGDRSPDTKKAEARRLRFFCVNRSIVDPSLALTP